MLKHLNVNACPVCGETEVVTEKIKTHNKKIMYHTNGKRWEEREFACGNRLEYSANSSRVHNMSSYPCKNDRKIADQLKERLDFLGKVLINVSEIQTEQDDFKNEIVYSLSKQYEQLENKLKGIVG